MGNDSAAAAAKAAITAAAPSFVLASSGASFRLASLYVEMKRYDEALAASDRAVAKVYGPRRILVLSTRASIYKEKGDKAAARATLAEAIKIASSQPKADRQLAELKKQLDDLR